MFQPSPFQWNFPNSAPLYPAPQRSGVKRKSRITPDEVLIPPPPEKHFVTDEEMTEFMSRLQIDQQHNIFTNYTDTSTSSTTPYTYPQNNTSTFGSSFIFNAEGQFTGFGQSGLVEDRLEEVQFSEEDLPKLSISEEVYKFKPEPLLPPSLTQSLSSNQMALVPWVPRILTQLTEDKKEVEDHGDNDKMAEVGMEEELMPVCEEMDT